MSTQSATHQLGGTQPGKTHSSDNPTFTVENPATGETIGDVPDCGEGEAIAALDTAVSAATYWAGTSPRLRSDVLYAGATALLDHRDELAELITLEMGKPIAEARGEVAYAADFMRWFAEEASRIRGTTSDAPTGNLTLTTRRRPVGPCLLITPWNFPLAMAARKIAPALAAGCTVVVKPATLTPLTTLRFAELLSGCGVPEGVINVVTTTRPREVIEPLLADSRLRKLSFTGSTGVGSRLLASAAPNVLRTSMELGGNAPFIVFEDSDLEAAVAGAAIAKLRNTGQACTAANRFLVHERVLERFTDLLVTHMAGLKVGPGADESVTLGPMIDAKAVLSVDSLVQDAVKRGARVRIGGAAFGTQGHFYLPTVLTDIPEDAQILHDEIFGPVAPIISFSDEAEAVALANATQYGLVAYAYTKDADRIDRLQRSLEVGMIGINTGLVSNAAAPFGGVKHSGLGREGGAEGIDEYLETVYVARPRG